MTNTKKSFLWEPWRKKYDELEKIYNECKRTHDRYTKECLDEKIALDKVERDMVKPTQNKDNAYELLKDYLKTVKWNDHFVMGINEMSVEWTFVGRDGTSDYIFKSYKDYKKACTVLFRRIMEKCEMLLFI